jgi:hypothetical protein
MMLLGNVGQQLDIGDIEQSVGRMQSILDETQSLDRRQERSIDDLRKENHGLKLYLATLVKLLVSKGVIRQEEVDAAVQAVEKT